MDFNLTEEQRMLKDSVDRFLEKNFSFEQRRQMLADRQPMSAQLWQGLAELGVLGMPFSPDDGGFGGGGVETMLVMQALGRNLTLEPYLATVVLAGSCVALGAAEWQKKILLPGIIDGSLILAFAHAEPNSRFDFGRVETRASRDGNNFVLDGEKTLVLHGSVADKFIVSARTAGDPADEGGVTLFLVEADEENLGGQEYPLFDGTRALDLQLSGVKVGPESVIGTLEQARPLIDTVLDRAMAALCAEAVGIMDALHATTVEYLKTRQQFGQPIGRFQALQHRAVDMLVQLEQARSMALLAASKVDSPDVSERRRTIAAAKEMAGRAGRFVGQQAIQLHGGMGMTDELNVSHYFKRLTAIDVLFGNSASQRTRFATMMEGQPAAKLQAPRKSWVKI
ncbi:MAG TPA: acyl-CoA dehydrogenase family protein [Planctomycetaceae bacterium]|nr:acyl-CoA dehydrogenase family protein [Planctomycetaceae bacterium]